MLPENTNKHVWLKKLRGMNMTHGEYRVLVNMYTYTDSKGRGAHPGLMRIAEDAGVQRNTARRALAMATEVGWLTLTRKGGNHIAKGLADEYELAIPKHLQSAKGSLGVPLEKGSLGVPLESQEPVDNSPEAESPRGQSEPQGVNPDTPQGYLSGSLKGSVGVPPSDQYIIKSSSSDALHASDSSNRVDSARPSGSNQDSTAEAGGREERGIGQPYKPQCLQGYTWTDLQGDWDLLHEWLEEQLGYLEGTEWSTAEGMYLGDAHPLTIFNKIRADRREAAA